MTTPKETTATPVIDVVDNPTATNNYTPTVNGHATPGAAVTVTDSEGTSSPKARPVMMVSLVFQCQVLRTVKTSR